MSTEARIRLTGFSDASVVESIFASDMVDVAYIDEVTPECIFIYTEPDVNLNNPSDYEWVKSIIKHAFEGTSQSGMTGLTVATLFSQPSGGP